MNWLEFERKIKSKHLRLFTPLDVERNFGVSHRAALKFLSRYVQKGGIVRIKRGLYSLADYSAPDLYIANKLYEPSYISLEFALSFHRIKPETVYTITSVTTKNAKKFEVLGCLFSYHHIKKKAFTGYKAIPYQGVTILMADPEKALVDHLYLRILSGKNIPVTLERVFERLKKENLDKSRAIKYAEGFDDNRLIAILKERLS